MSPTPADASAIRSQLRALEASNAFRESPRHRSLLAFLLETTLKGEADKLKEFTIAAEVWGRDVSFDPRIHSMVRVEIGRLLDTVQRIQSHTDKPFIGPFLKPTCSLPAAFFFSTGRHRAPVLYLRLDQGTGVAAARLVVGGQP